MTDFKIKLLLLLSSLFKQSEILQAFETICIQTAIIRAASHTIH